MTRSPRASDQSGDRDELERFKRDINLTEFAAARGYRIDRRESSRGSVVMRHAATDDKIIIAKRGADNHWTYFSVRDDRDNGTVLDFVQRRDGATLGEVRKELRSWTGSERPTVRPDDYVSTVVSPARDRVAVRRLFEAARPASNSPYLNSRGIRPETLTTARFRETFRVDARGNVLFPHRDDQGICGFESKNHQWTSFASGGTKALWMSSCEPTDTRLVFVEGAIDALSYYQLRPTNTARYASTAGELGRQQIELVRRAVSAMPSGSIVALAFDADAAGDKLAADVACVAKGVVLQREQSPIGKDWNDAIKHIERDYIQSLERRRALGLERSGR
jgi:Toprim-like/Protein of unknown function (DUF3991)